MKLSPQPHQSTITISHHATTGRYCGHDNGGVKPMTATSIQKDAILSLCARIQAAAIKCEAYHVFVSYSPHVGWLAVYVERTDTEYTNPERVIDRLIYEVVYIDRADSLEHLTALVDQLQRLGVEV